MNNLLNNSTNPKKFEELYYKILETNFIIKF